MEQALQRWIKRPPPALSRNDSHRDLFAFLLDEIRKTQHIHKQNNRGLEWLCHRSSAAHCVTFSVWFASWDHYNRGILSTDATPYKWESANLLSKDTNRLSCA